MNPSDVTDAMVERFRSAACFEKQCCTVEESIAASVNAVLGDQTPITSEWLVKNGWIPGHCGLWRITEGVSMRIWWDTKCIVIVGMHGGLAPTAIKTIGQLRALEIGLGITQ